MLSPQPPLHTSFTSSSLSKLNPKRKPTLTTMDMSMPPLIDPDAGRRSYPSSPWPGVGEGGLGSGGGAFGSGGGGPLGGGFGGSGFGFGGPGGGAFGQGQGAFGASGGPGGGAPSPYTPGTTNSPFLHPPPPGVTSGGQPGGAGFGDGFGFGSGFGSGGSGGSGWPHPPHSAPPTSSFPGFSNAFPYPGPGPSSSNNNPAFPGFGGGANGVGGYPGFGGGFASGPGPGGFGGAGFGSGFGQGGGAGAFGGGAGAFGGGAGAFGGGAGGQGQGPGGNGGGGGTNGNTPALSFGAQTPAGSYGPPATPGGYTPWSAPGGGGGDPWGNAAGIPSGGFFGAQPQPQQPQPQSERKKKKKKRSESMKRAMSEGPGRPASAGDMRRSGSGGNLGFGFGFGANPSSYPPFGPSSSYPPFGVAGNNNYPPFGYPPFTPGGSTYYPPFTPGGYGQMDTTGQVMEVYGPKNLARRPGDWRADYVVPSRGGFVSGIRRVVAGRGGGEGEISDQVKRKLHPLLEYKPDNPPIEHDLRTSPLTTPNIFMNIDRPHNNIDFAQLACSPPTVHMRLYHPLLPWYVDVRASHPNGVTVYDVMSQMYRELMKGITGRHWWNEEVGDELRAMVSEAYGRRIREAEKRGDRSERGRGVVWLDWLGDRCIFEGLARGRNGMWEIKTGRVVEATGFY